MDKVTADSRSVQSFATEHWNFVIGRFNTRATNGFNIIRLRLALKCTVAPSPQQTPLLRFFLKGGGGGGCTQTM